MKQNLSKRILSLLLAAVMLLGLAVPVNAADHRHTHATGVRFQETKASADMPMLGAADALEEEAPEYEETDIVRVSIILDKESTLQAGFSTMDIATNEEAMSYRGELAQEQTAITGSIEKALEAELDVQWNLTLAANLISANVAYGDIAAIEKVEGVAQVVLETLYEPCVVADEGGEYEPNTQSSTYQVGVRSVWTNGYTGAGSRVAVIDTGIDLDHQSFSSKGFEYSLKLNAEKAGMSYEDYVASLDLLDKEEILSVADKLNIPNVDVDKAYNTTKIPFGYNYIDVNYRVVHDYDSQGSHGSHVEGIAAANAYLPQRDGSFVKADEAVGVVGVAPDAQIISMKVFGVGGGAYSSDYMAAIEDAIILGCDSVNLSLGSAAPGFTNATTYEELMESLQNTDTVVTMSAGNSYHWFNRVTGSKLFVQDIRFHTGGSPGSYSNSLGVASVDNAGFDDDGNYVASEYQTMSTFSSWGVPESLELKPEITAPGGNIYSVNGETIGGKSYELMSGTSMSAPQMAGSAAVMAQYIRENNLVEKTGLTVRQLSQSLMMSTAMPLFEKNVGYYYPVLKQGAGLVQLDDATAAQTYILMGEDATAHATDGKVKVELGDDPERTGVYTFSFTINNFSGEDNVYRLAAELFTQNTDGKYLLQTTAPLTANYTYKIDGATYVPEVVGVECDLNADGKTDAADAQMILDYVAGLATEIDPMADVDANGTVETYDAHLLLAGLESGEFTVPAGKSVQVQVIAELTEEQKTSLDAVRPNGAYVEGFVFVNPAKNEEGNLCDSAHSIPVLGFYGNWTDPSMFGVTYAEQLYGDTRKAYTGATQNNNLVINRDGESFFQVGNPYKVETSYPAGREAVRSTDILESYNSMMIRNAAAMVVLIEDEAGNLLYNTSLNTMLAGAYYYVNGGAWRNTDSSQVIGQLVKDLGLKENDRFTVTTVAIPEYYALGETLTVERVREIMASGVLGEGAYLRTEMVVDDTAPEVIAISRDIDNQNKLIVNVKDNQQTAAMSLVKLDGSKTYTTILPETFGEPGSMQVFTLDLTGIKAGEKCLLVLGDYAGNERAYEVTLNLEEEDDGGEGGGGEPVPDDVNNNFYGYSVLSGNVWMNADLDYANYSTVGGTNVDVVAAEYVDGYVYTVGSDNKLYVAPHGNWSGATCLSDCSAYGIEDMAFNYADNKLYALGAGNIIYTVDLMTGELTEQFYVTIINPKAKTDEAYKLLALAIDDEGKFYVVNHGAGATFASYLYSFTLDMVKDGAVKDIDVKSKSVYIIGYNQGGATLAWDHDDDRLYYYGKYSGPTGLSALDYPGWFNLGTYRYSSSGTNHKKGFMAMYFTAPDVGVVPETDVVESFTVNPTEMKMVVGATAQIATAIKPWNLKDQSLTWESSDASVVTVTDGLMTALKKGTATVTVTTNAAPYIQHKIEVAVGDLPDVNLNAYLQDEVGNALWVNFNSLDVENWQIIGEAATDSLGGVILNDTLYYHNRSYVYAADPDTFEAEAVFEVGVKKSTENCYYDWSSAAPAERTEDGYFDRLIMPVANGTVLTILNPYENKMVDMDISHLGALAMIATVGFERTTVVSEKTGATYENCPQYIFYGVAESGNIYELKLAAYPDESDDGINEASYRLTTKAMGTSSLKLPSVANATSTNAGGLVYDPVSGCLVLLHYGDGDSTARLYAIVPESGATLELGTVRDAVWPAYSLYQYTAPTEMTLRVRQSVLNLVEGDSAQINASVAPAQDYTGGVTFVSNDPAIATVDENGLVVGVKAGVTTITVATEDKTLSKEVAVNVEAAMKVDLTVNAKLDLVDEGSNWVVIDTKDITNPTIRAYDHSYMKIGGVHDGKIYGGDGDWYSSADLSTVTDFVMVEPEYDYEATFIAYLNPQNIPFDLTTMPAYELAYTDAEGNPAAITVGDMPIFVDINENIYMFNQEEMNLRGWAMFGEFDGVPGAMDFMGMTTVTEAGVEYPAYSYAVLTTSGVLYNFFVIPRVELDNEGVATVKYRASLEEVGNVGLRFNFAANMGMVYVNDGTNLGLLISYNDKRPELYYVEISLDMLEVKYNSGKIGTIPGANFIGVLHFDSALNLPEEAPNLVSGQVETVEAADIRSSGKVTVSGNNEASDAMAMSAVQEAEEIRNNSTFVPGDGTIAIELTEDVATSNGILEVSYDPAVLTYVNTTSTNLVAVNATEGKVLVAYASGRELPVGSALATVNFTFAGGYIETTVTVKALQRNTETTVTEEGEVIDIACEVGDHKYEVTEKVEPKCLEAGYQIWTCTKCGDSYREELPATGHSYKAVVTEPTCTEMGYTTYTCACGDTYKDNYVNPTGHNYVKTVTAPTCTEAGYTTYTCACGESYVSDYVDPIPHSFGEWKVTKPATCTEDGVETRTCACGATETREIEATGHSFGEWKVTKPATCTEDGVETRVCACGEAENREIRATGHSFGEWVVTTPATCTEKGVETRTCANCGETETRPTEAYGHNWSDWTVTKAATCTEKGEEIRTCGNCGKTEKRAIDALGHDCTSVTVPVTCTTDGYTEYTCKVCGYSYRDEVVKAIGHNYEATVTAPTCTDKGYTTYTCKNCGDSYITDYVDALGHTFGEWKVTKAATCTEEGVETRTCACGETETRAIPATGHSFGEWTLTKAPTCTENGVETRTCACGETEERIVAALGHDVSSKVVTPTCTEEGYTEHTCQVCGYSYREDIVPALGHEYEANVVAPTCTEVGYTEYICAACGDSYVTDYVPATGHTFGEWILTTEPGCETVGIETRYCEDCDATETREVAAYCPAEKFTDVDTEQWYHEGICFAIRNGLMKGKSETVFAPNANLTRAELVTVLYRMAGEPSVEGLEHPFVDVAAGQWYSDAIVWAYNAEVVNGTSDTTFAPGASITREQIAAILFRFSGADAEETDALADFSDADKVNAYAVEAMNWAVANGLINGMGDGTLAPQGNATRAQIATILMRYCQM